MAQSVGHLIEEQEVPGLILSLHLLLWTLIMKFFYPHFPLIQEGQLSVTGESMDP